MSPLWERHRPVRPILWVTGNSIPSKSSLQKDVGVLWLWLLRWWLGDDYVGQDTPRTRKVEWGIDRITSGCIGHITGGFLIAVSGWPPVPSLFWLGVFIVTLGTPILMSGCIRHVRKKGYHAGVGVALTLLSLLGVFLVLVLPKRNKGGKGFEVITARRVVDTWVTEDPKQTPRPWADPSEMAKLWQSGKSQKPS